MYHLLGRDVLHDCGRGYLLGVYNIVTVIPGCGDVLFGYVRIQRVIEWSSWFLRIRSQRLLNRQIRSQSSRSLRVEPQLIGEKYLNSFNKWPL